MGTWDAGPFSNDAALDFVGDVLDSLMEAVDAFIDEPLIDETFDAAFAAIALMNEVMRVTPSRPWRDKAVLDPRPICEAMLRCFDDQIDGLEPEPAFKDAQRAALVTALDTFTKFLQR